MEGVEGRGMKIVILEGPLEDLVAGKSAEERREIAKRLFRWSKQLFKWLDIMEGEAKPARRLELSRPDARTCWRN